MSIDFVLDEVREELAAEREADIRRLKAAWAAETAKLKAEVEKLKAEIDAAVKTIAAERKRNAAVLEQLDRWRRAGEGALVDERDIDAPLH